MKDKETPPFLRLIKTERTPEFNRQDYKRYFTGPQWFTFMSEKADAETVPAETWTGEIIRFSFPREIFGYCETEKGSLFFGRTDDPARLELTGFVISSKEGEAYIYRFESQTERENLYQFIFTGGHFNEVNFLHFQAAAEIINEKALNLLNFIHF